MSGPVSPPLTVTTVGGTPSGRPITTIKVSNGDLTISGNTATIDTSGGGGGGGSVTSITFSSPLTGGTITTTGTVGIPEADATTDGYLSSTDWNTFNNKGTGTVTGTGANEQVAVWSGTSAVGGSTGFTWDATVLTVNSAGTGDPKINLTSSTKAVSFEVETNQILSVQGSVNKFLFDASSGTGGITWPDGTTQITANNNTGTIGGSIANTQVAYGSGANTIQGSSNLTFDGTNLDVAGYVKAGTIYIGNGAGQVETIGATDLILQTNEGSNSGTLTIKNGVDGNAVFQPNGTGAFQFNGVSGGEDGRIMLMCSEGTHSQTISAAPHASAATYELVLPTGLPADADNKYLVSDTSGNMSFTTASGGGGGTPAGSDREIQFNDNGSFGAVSAFKIGSSNTIGIGTSPSSAYSLKTLSNIQCLGTVDASSFKGTNGGSATQPTFKYSTNNTGLFFSATDQIDFTMGGSNKLSFGSAGEILIGGTTAGTAGQVLTSGGSGSAMSWAAAGGGGGINWPNSISTYTGTFGYGDNLGIGFNGRLSTQSVNLGQWANTTIRYRPWICMKEGNLANWYIWVGGVPTGGSDQTWSVGLWNVGTDNVPGTLKCTSDITISSSTGILSGTWTAEAGQDLAVKMGDTYWVGYYSNYSSSASSANLYWFTGAQVTAFPGRRPNSNTGNTSDPCRVYGSAGDIATIGDNPTITGSDTQTTTGWPIMWYTVS